MTTKKLLLAALSATLLSASPLAVAARAEASKQLFVLDLSTAAADGEEAVEPGGLEVLLLNTIPAAAYSTRWVVERVEQDVLQLPQLPVIPSSIAAAAGGDCDDLDNAVDALATKTTEQQVAESLEGVAKAKGGCKDPDSLSAAARALQSTERRVTLSRSLARGERATLTITRFGGADGSTKTWTRTFTAPKLGRWLTSYGFNFIESDSEAFTARVVAGQENQFAITKNSDRQDYDFRPAVFFTFVPASWDRGPLSYGVSGGVDFDNENAAVFLGGSFYVGDNLQISLGGVMRQVDRLRGEYSVGQVLGTQVAGDQLVEQTYKPSFFLGLGFRFDRSPFRAPGADGENVGGSGSGD